MENHIYLSALLIGATLGLIGGGGSILTVPLLVYIASIKPELATAYSLFIVGISASFGAYRAYTKDQLQPKLAIIFALPSLITIYVTRKWIIPNLPETILQIQSIELSRGGMMMLLFSILMFSSSMGMFFKKSKQIQRKEKEVKIRPLFLTGIGLFLGLISGLVGAGGGFLIVPALVLVINVPMKKAIGTSLMIIAINSLTGFMGDIFNPEVQWKFLLGFSSLSVVGIFIGNRLVDILPARRLKHLFSYFVLLMSIVVAIKEVLAL